VNSLEILGDEGSITDSVVDDVTGEGAEVIVGVDIEDGGSEEAEGEGLGTTVIVFGVDIEEVRSCCGCCEEKSERKDFDGTEEDSREDCLDLLMGVVLLLVMSEPQTSDLSRSCFTVSKEVTS
jgi:hypothetical protein